METEVKIVADGISTTPCGHTKADSGFWCSRAAGHDGPCAAYPTPPNAVQMIPRDLMARMFTVEETERMVKYLQEIFQTTSVWANYTAAKKGLKELLESRGYKIE